MRIPPLFALLITALVIASACERPPAGTSNQRNATSATPVKTVATPKDGNYNARGRITKINNELGSVELDHEDIPGVMPPMIMEFYVRDPSQLATVKVGDTVDFVLEYKHPTETIVAIKKAP